MIPLPVSLKQQVSTQTCLPLPVSFFQLYEINDDPKRKEFLDDLFSYMQKRGESLHRPSRDRRPRENARNGAVPHLRSIRAAVHYRRDPRILPRELISQILIVRMGVQGRDHWPRIGRKIRASASFRPRGLSAFVSIREAKTYCDPLASGRVPRRPAIFS